MAGNKKAKKEKKKAKKAAKKARKEAKRAAKAAGAKAVKAVVAKKAARKAGKPAAKKARKATRKAVHKASAPSLPPPRKKVDRQQPESLRLRSAGPSFTVNDLEKSLSFYRDVLGFTAGERYEQDGQLQGIELMAGSVVFWLGQDDWKKGRDRVKGQGFRLYCTTSQDIDALAARVKAAGGNVVEEPREEPWGGRAFGVRDDDGFTITFASSS